MTKESAKKRAVKRGAWLLKMSSENGKRKSLQELRATNSIKVLSFDLDDTIWQCRPVLARAERAQAAFVRQFYPELEQHINRKSWSKLEERAMAAHAHMLHNHTFRRKQTLLLAAQEAELEEPMKVSEDVFHAFITARNNVLEHVYPGVIETLKELKSRYTLVALTNGNADVQKIPGLRHLFEHSVQAEETGAGKPNKQPFERVLSLTGVAAHEVVHIGDSLESDVQGAIDMGMHAVWVSRGRTEDVEDVLLTVECASELREHLSG